VYMNKKYFVKHLFGVGRGRMWCIGELNFQKFSQEIESIKV